ncbi:hypothetical protein EVAR_92411_1, partial [Eumeta japonica]
EIFFDVPVANLRQRRCSRISLQHRMYVERAIGVAVARVTPRRAARPRQYDRPRSRARY